MSKNTYVALLRGINVGGNNPLPMQSLLQLLTTLGCEQVKTYIQSGNVVFAADKRDWSQMIAEAIAEEFGFRPAVLVLGASAFRDITNAVPFPRDSGKALHAFFLADPPVNPDLTAIESLASESEKFALREGAFFLYAPDGIGRSKLAAKVEKLLGVEVTARNWNTVDKLLTMLEESIC